jgi:RimJ/RimL family protein N-acetyltransferase
MHPTTINFPLPITTPRLLLRQPILKSDAPEYSQAVTESINELKPWMLWALRHQEVEQAENYIRECHINWMTKNNNNVGLPLWIIEKETGVFVGHIVMWNINWNIPRFEIGFWARTPYAGKGYITEAVNALTRYCFSQLGARRIEIRCETKNIRSQLVPQRLGFQLDGVLRNNALAVADGKITDTLVFSRVDLKDLPEVKVE